MASLPSAFEPTNATASSQSTEAQQQPQHPQQTSTTTSNATTRKRRPRKKKPPPNVSNSNVETNVEANATLSNESTSGNDSKQPSNKKADAPSKNQIRNDVRNAKRKMQRKKKKQEIQEQQQQQEKQHEWWRKQLPPDDPVDPITLESLHTLQYPPFALVASPPYIPIDWPPNQNENKQDSTTPNNYTEEERQRQIIEEQWGKLRLDDQTDDDNNQKVSTESTSNKRHVNLFDGRALAYYMVSQSQFIDPLNRRDITRDELIHLDYYLRQYNFNELNVVEAYDTKGITLSSAGATANTAMGRSMILQQEARILLNALFGGTHTLHNNNNNNHNHLSRQNNTTTSTTAHNNTNSLMQQYEAYESEQLRQQQQQQQIQRHRGNHQSSSNRTSQYNNEQRNNGNIYDSGMIIIDDDENPGLRGNSTTAPSTLYSANHISARYGQSSSSGNVRENDFPSLAATLPVGNDNVQETPAIPPASKALPKTKTLSKISKMVKQTNPEEQQRQWEAREAARRKAMLSNLTFGANPTFTTTTISDQQQQQYLSDGIPSQISMTGPSEAQIERNRAFAEALGVQPATIRNNSTKLNGWMRPTEHTFELDEYGNELNVTIYPDSFIKHAKEMRYDIILKLEKKWKLFLNDDKAASLPLYPMDKANRAFVHEYAEYWKLHTESFDPEPKRYVHCVKLRDTCAPYPLLSDAMKSWQPSTSRNTITGTGSTLAASAFYSNDHSTNQTAGQSTTSEQHREFPSDVTHQRVPLSLKPRSLSVPQQQQYGAASGTPIGGIPSRTMTESIDNSRFDSLNDGRERPKLQLQKRTLPLDLPAQNVVVDVNDGKNEQYMIRQMMKQQKDKERNEKKQRALQAAFASDDEHDSDSEWVEQVAIYHSSSEDEHHDESFWT